MLTLLVAIALLCWLLPKLIGMLFDKKLPGLVLILEVTTYLIAIIAILWCIHRIVFGASF